LSFLYIDEDTTKLYRTSTYCIWNFLGFLSDTSSGIHIRREQRKLYRSDIKKNGHKFVQSTDRSKQDIKIKRKLREHSFRYVHQQPRQSTVYKQGDIVESLVDLTSNTKFDHIYWFLCHERLPRTHSWPNNRWGTTIDLIFTNNATNLRTGTLKVYFSPHKIIWTAIPYQWGTCTYTLSIFEKKNVLIVYFNVPCHFLSL
jgi:hypothetical protein